MSHNIKKNKIGNGSQEQQSELCFLKTKSKPLFTIKSAAVQRDRATQCYTICCQAKQ